MDKEKTSKDFTRAHETGYERAKEFDNSNCIDKALWISKDRSHYPEEKNKGYEQGVKDYWKNHS